MEDINRLYKLIRDGQYPIDQVRLWVFEHYPESNKHEPDYDLPRARISAVLRWYDELLTEIKKVESGSSETK